MRPAARLPIDAACLALLAMAAGPGCTHAVLFDDPAPIVYPEKAIVRVGYHLAPGTLDLVHSFRSWSSGILNRWVIYPGQVLDQYSRAYLARAFEVFQPAGDPVPSASDPPFVLTMEIPHFEIAGWRAHLTVAATVRDRDGKVVQHVERTRAGASGAARVFWGGAATTKSMVRRSTDSAIRPALAEIVQELRKASAAWARPAPPGAAPGAGGATPLGPSTGEGPRQGPDTDDDG